MFKVFPGANDNASGCAVVMELARAFAKMENKPKRSIVFAFFGSEETGRLGGSTHVANTPPYSNRLPEFMFNYDIVASGEKLLLSGGSLEDKVVQEMIKIEKENAIGLKIISVGDEHYYKSSDHAPFEAKGVQAYGNFSADAKWDFMHTEYDNMDAVEAEPMEKLVKLYFLLLNDKLNE
jgi:Zn-dependent M28 family amino/carboxypeptidase